VLLDLKLPRMDGFALLDWIRADPGLAETTVVAVSAMGPRIEAKRRALDAGCDAFLPKPFELEDLLACVERHLPPAAPGGA
jgi:CheY-like chemotaxis protein